MKRPIHTLGALVRREVREQRRLLLGLSVLGCLGMAAFHGADLVWNPYAWTIDALGPAWVYSLLAAGLLITESLTRDSEHENGERLNSLPVGRLALVGAKLVWLGLAVLTLTLSVRLAEVSWLYLVGSSLEGLLLSHVGGRNFPLFIYAPIWIGWAVALGLLFRRWLMAALALFACVGVSIHLWPWPLGQAAVLPGWVVGTATCAVPALLVWCRFRPGWLLPTEVGRALAQACALGVILFGAIGVTQVQGRTRVEWPRPDTARITATSLSPDGTTLNLIARSSFPLLSGKQGWRHHLWDVDTDTGTLKRDLWSKHAIAQGYRSRRIPRTLDSTKGNLVAFSWFTGPRSPGDLSRNPGNQDNPLNHRGIVRTTDEGTLRVSVPEFHFEEEIPWTGHAYVGVEVGVLYSLNDRVLRRHDLLAGNERILAELPAPTTSREWSLEVCRYGGVLRLRVFGEVTRFLDATDGTLLASIGPEWHYLWTDGPSPFAVARRVRHTPNHGVQWVESLESLWISRNGAKEVHLPMDGRVISSASGRVFLAGDEGIAELDAEGRVLRPLRIVVGPKTEYLP